LWEFGFENNDLLKAQFQIETLLANKFTQKKNINNLKKYCLSEGVKDGF